MSYHKLLQKQINKYLPEELRQDPALQHFFLAINESYSSYERDKELLNHAFSISEQEYQTLYENLNREYELKNISIEKLRQAVRNIKKENDSDINFDNEDLLIIVDYINSEVHKRKETEDNLNRTLKLLTTLLSNLNSGILVEDEHRKILYTNQLFCDMFAIAASPDQMTGIDCSDSAEQSKHYFENPDQFVTKISEVLRNKVAVFDDELKLTDGRILKRDYIPIYIDNQYRGHLWDYEDVTDRKKFENQLVDVTNIQNAILNGTDYSIIYTDTNGVIKSFNQGAEKMLGYLSSEVVGIHTPAIFHDISEVASKAKSLTQELGYEIKTGFDVFVAKSRNQSAETNEWTYIKKNKERINVLLSVSSIRNSKNEIIGYLGIARDITEQKIAETELKRSEERYRNIVENSTDIIYKINKNGYFTYVNPVAERITGYKQEELLNKQFTKLIRNDFKKETIIFYNEQIELKKPTTYYEFPITTKNGEERWIGQSVQLSELSKEDFELTALAIDVTERKNYERTIFLQKEKYQNIIANMNLGLLEVDQEEKIQYVNPGFEFISGYKAEELIGKNAAKLLVSESHLNLVKSKQKLRAEGQSDSYEVPIINKKGELKWWMISGAPNYDNKGKLIGSIGIHLDITEQKQLELDLELSKSKAEESSKAKEAFLANMSHEIRTPLNAIIGMIRELSKEKLSPKQETFVENTAIASQHLLSVLNNILDISKIEAGELQLDLHHFDLQKILNDVKSIMLAKCGEKGLYLKINHIENKNVTFIGDSSRFRQILLNLIGNAVKFTDYGGITVEYDVEDLHTGYQAVYISVSDTGVGMDESFLKNIFNKFSQEDSSTSRKYGGSGLGMAITKELIQLMNGSIEIKSQKNVGTEIVMKFLMPIGDPSKLLKNDFVSVENTGKLLNILLVEDNEFNRLVACNTLNHFNCKITEAVNGLEAIDILKSGKSFDVILMDLQMPVMDGFESTRIIREILKIATPIIALTANAFKSELELCLKLGMNDCVTKPFEEEKLLNSIYKLTQSNDQVPILEALQKQNSSKKLYDLSQLKSMSRNNDEYCKKMISLFIEQSTEALSQIIEAYAQKDLTTVHSISHRIKPSMDLMGIELLKQPIRFIEKQSRDNRDSEELKQQIYFLREVLNNTLIQLKEEEV
ncbi:MAG: PAS domain S-box protein [Bacteroidetes bacterium]|nr:PAS domain S-box protein [Bacteroidota bacterium]